MVAASEVSGKLLMVSQSRRYFRAGAAFGRQLAELGTIGSLSCEFFKAPHFSGFRERMAEPLLVDMAIHQFDLSRKLIGSEPVSVYCESYNPDWSWFDGNAAANAMFTFADGTRFAFTGSWCAPGLETSWNGRWRASASGGTATWDGDNPPVAELASGEALPAVMVDDPEQIAGSLVEFVAAVRESTVPQSEVHSNVISVAMVEAAVRSASSGYAGPHRRRHHRRPHRSPGHRPGPNPAWCPGVLAEPSQSSGPAALSAWAAGGARNMDWGPGTWNSMSQAPRRCPRFRVSARWRPRRPGSGRSRGPCPRTRLRP